MKNLMLILMLLFGLSAYSQTMEVSDWNNDGILEFVKYSEDGIMVEKGNLLNGKYHGNIYSYYTNGDIKSVSRFNNGVKEGTWKLYNTNGDITHEIVYEDNRRVQASITRYFE